MSQVARQNAWVEQPPSGVYPKFAHAFDPIYLLRGGDDTGYHVNAAKAIRPATATAQRGGMQSGDGWKLHATSSAINVGVTSEWSQVTFAAMMTLTPLTLAFYCRLLSTKYDTSLNSGALDLSIGTDGHPNLGKTLTGNIYDETTGKALVVGKTSTVIYTYDWPTQTIRVFVDGIKHGSASVNAFSLPTPTQIVCGKLATDHSDSGQFILHGLALSNTAANLPDSVLAELSANPWELYEPEETMLWGAAPGGGTAHNLEGAAAAQAAATGAITLAVPIAGAGVSVATASGALSVAIPLAGAASAQASASGDLSTSGGASLAGNASVSASAFGALSLSVPLSGLAVAQALASAGLAHGVPLAGTAAGQAAASGSMSINVSLAGLAIAQAAAAAGLTVTNANSLAGAAAAQASASANLTHAVPLSGAALTVSNTSGSLTHIVPLSGSAAAASLATGGLDVTVNLDADALAQAMASAGLTVTAATAMSGNAIAQAAANGTLTLRVNLDGAAVANATASGALAGTGLLSGTPGYKVARTPRTWRVARTPRTWRVAA